METLGYLEVILRNALHDQLAAWHANRQRPGEWFDDPAQVLLQHRRTDIAEAKRRITLAGRPLAPGRMVAELTFGFWRFLLDRRCQNTLWAPALRHAFPNLVPQRRVDVYNPIDRLLRVRNRIAHHEPVHYLPLEARYDDVLEILGFIDSAVQGWVAAGSRVPAVLATKP
jgi:hypothetical protein